MGSGMFNGTDNMVSAKGIVPWHGKGVVSMKDVLTSKEALELSGGNYTIRYEPIRYNGVNLPVKQCGQLVIREDLNMPIGTVGRQQAIINNSEAFEFLDFLLEGHQVGIETAGSLYHGAKFYIVAVMPDKMVIGGDEYSKYIVVMTAHDGSCQLMSLYTNVRVVCANTWAAAIRDAENNVYKIKHTKNHRDKWEQARTVFIKGQQYHETFKQVAEDLLAASWNRQDWNTLVATLYPITDETTKRGLTVRQNAREAIDGAYGADDLGNISGTAWSALQAVIDIADRRPLKDTNKNLAPGELPTNPVDRHIDRTLFDNDLKLLAAKFIQDRTGVPILAKA